MNRWYRAAFHLTGDLRAQAIDDVEPAIAALEVPTHAGFGRVAVEVTEYVGVAAGEDGSMPFSVELDIIGSGGLAHCILEGPAPADCLVNA